MEGAFQYVADVEQFARLRQLVEAIKDVKVLLKDTEEFVIKYCSRGELGMPITLIVPVSEI
jgi:hypothetical protein